MAKLFEYKDHTLYGWRERDTEDTYLHSYEVHKPDGKFVILDIDPKIHMTRFLFYKWVDIGCPDRMDLRKDEYLEYHDIEAAWDKLMGNDIVI